MDNKSLERFIQSLDEFYEVSVIGKSELGREIYAVKKEFNSGYKWALITGGIHAREHLSCDFICHQISRLKFFGDMGYNLAFVPLVNPDGAGLCINGLEDINEEKKIELISINGSEDFSLFKANARGVDLNNNWNANWENNFSKKTKPSMQGYYGESPMSESEVIALSEFTRKLDIFLSLCYHLKGEEIYFDFFQDRPRYKRDKKIAKIFSRSTGYRIKSTQSVSSGGFKDWCVKELKVPSLTIELGSDKIPHPYPATELDEILYKNRNFYIDISSALKIYEAFF